MNQEVTLGLGGGLRKKHGLISENWDYNEAEMGLERGTIE